MLKRFLPVIGMALLVAPSRIEEDARFAKIIVLPPVALYAEDLRDRIQNVSAVLGCELEVLDCTSRALIIGRADSATTAECLQAFAVAVGGEWLNTARGWTLTEHPELRRIAALSRDGRRQEMGKVFPVLKREGLRHWKLLERRGYLEPRDLDLAGQQALRSFVQVMYHYAPDVAAEALDLDGCGIYMVVSREAETKALTLCFSLHLPTNQGTHQNFSSLPIRMMTEEEFAQIPRRKWEIRTPPPNRVPASHKRRYPLVDLEAEALQQPFVGRPGAVNQVARLLIQQKVPLFVGSRYHYALVPLPAKPTVATTMKEMAQVTGGTWRQVGPLYALEPHPLVERCAQLDGGARDFWRQELVKRIKDTLSPKQKERLADQGYLKPRDLREEQRVAATWLTALEFVQFNQPAAACLDQEPRLEREPNGYALTYRDAAEAETGRIRLQ